MLNSHSLQRKNGTTPSLQGERISPSYRSSEREHSYIRQIHALSWQFNEEFRPDDRQWTCQGQQLAKKIESFAKKHPEIGLFKGETRKGASLPIVLVPHTSIERFRSRDVFWGANLYLIGDSADPVEIFLYPQHAQQFIDNLNSLGEKAGDKSGRSINSLYQDLSKQFLRGPDKEEWKYCGHKLMEKLDEFCKNHQLLREGRCDDGVHASSSLYVGPYHVTSTSQEPRKRELKAWVIGVPQLTGGVGDVLLSQDIIKRLTAHLKELIKLNGRRS